MSLRVPLAGALAVLLASLSLSSVIATPGWILSGVGALMVAVAAGLLTRASRFICAAGVATAVLASVVPLLTRPSWWERGAAIAIVVVVGLSALESRFLRALAVLAGYLATMLLYLNLVFAHAASYGYLIPSAHSLGVLGAQWRTAFAEFQYAPPVPDITAVSLVTSVGIGIVAIAVDLLAARLRHPALAGIPLLVLYSVPVASKSKVFGGPQIVIFAIALAGYLGMLSADSRERLRMWGRLVTFRHVQSADEAGTGPDTSQLAASGRKIGLAAVCLAIIIPFILPSLHTQDIFATSGVGSGDGGGSAAVSPLLNVQSLLEAKPQPVLSYTTTAASPREQYFQVYVLNYDAHDNQWKTSLTAADRAVLGPVLPWRAPGVTKAAKVTTVTTQVHIGKNDNGPAVLPVPYAPVRLTVPGGGWQETGGSLMVFSPGVSLDGLHYTVISREDNPRASAIPDVPPPGAISAAYGAYDGPDAIRLQQIANQHTAGATTPLAQALALQKWFLSGAFRYSLRPGLPSGNWLLRFLTRDRRGFCSQFAQAFAILARELGIPSRVAIGYTGGSPGPGGTWQITTADAHAWPELYFAGEGWLRFEPTPSGPHGQGTASVPQYAGGPPPGGGAAPGGGTGGNLHNRAGGAPGGHRPNALNRFTQITAGNAAGGSAGRHRSASLAGAGIAIAILIVLMLAWPMTGRQITRRRRWHAARSDRALAHVAWRELTDDLTDYGLPSTPGETPRMLTRRLSADLTLTEPAAGALARIAAAEEHACYARAPLSGDGLRTDSRVVRHAIAAWVSRRDRLRARLLPLSSLHAARNLSQRLGEVLSWLDLSWPALRRQLRGAADR